MRYDAFISYRHSELDMYVAKKIHKKLESFKIPRTIIDKSGKRRIERVFRDQEELPIGSDLADNIKQAISESQYLIVICSPRTPESYWVQKEINTFIAMHGREHILAVLIEGEPAESFPKEILFRDNGEAVEPLAADVRGKNNREINKKLKTETIRLAAPLIGCNYDDLRQRRRERRMKKVILASAAAAVLATAFGSYSYYNSMMIQKNYKGKLINQSKYLADTSLSLLEEGDRITAGLIAMEALPTKNHDRPYVAAAQYALSEALHSYKNGCRLEKDCLLKHDLPVKSFTYSRDGTKIVSIDQGNSVYVWEVENNTLLIKISPDRSYDGYVLETMDAVITDNNLIIATESRIYGMDLKGNEIWQTDTGNSFIACKFDTEAEIAACISGDEINFIDISEGSLIDCMVNPLEKESYFSSEAVFSMEHNKFAVAHVPLDKDESKGMVSIFDFKTSQRTEYVTKAVNIIEMAFCADGNLIVLSGNLLNEEDSDSKEGFVEKADVVSGKNIWCNTIKMNTGIETPSAILKCRQYKDEENKKSYDEVILSVDNIVYTWDAADGESISAVPVANGISSLLISQMSGFGYVIESDGRMNLFHLTEGWNNRPLAVDIGRQVRDVQINNNILAARISFSPDILLMKYHTGYGMEEAGTFKNTVLKMEYSADESYYVVETYAEDSEDFEKIYSFYNTEEGSLTNEWRGKTVDSVFTDNSHYAIVKEDGNIIIYNPENGEETALKPEEEMDNVQCCFSQENRFVFSYGWNEYYVADLWKQEIIAYGNGFDGAVISGGIISKDGKTFYGISDASVIRMDTATGESEILNLDGYHIAGSNNEILPLAISSDGKLLAVSCLDNKIRILDTKKQKILDEIEFSGQNRCFIGFTSDDNYLIMQGDTYYYRVYDIKKQGFLHISKTQHNMIRKAIYDDRSNTICLIADSEILILNEADYEPLAIIENGLMYMPNHAFVFNRYQNTVYRFPFMDMDRLIQEAEKQFGNAKLSEQERTQYNID